MITNINSQRVINEVKIDAPKKEKTPISFIKDEVKPEPKRKRKSKK